MLAMDSVTISDDAVNLTKERGPWMLTRFGHQFYPLDPKVEDFHVPEMAASLSKTCRYNGHTPIFYSVAEHCVLLAKYFLEKGQLTNAKWAWAHDAAETYIGDMIRPMKWMFPRFKEIEANIEKVFFNDFLKLEGTIPLEVMRIDGMICNDERFQLWDGVYIPETKERVVEKYGYLTNEKVGITLRKWHHERAELEYMLMYHNLFGDYATNQ